MPCRPQGGTPHPPIKITEHEGPNGFILGRGPATGQPNYRPGSGVTAGTGTADDPYVIEGLWIGLGDRPDPRLNAVGVLNSRDVTVTGNLWGNTGIAVSNSHDSTISGNTIVPEGSFPSRLLTTGIAIHAPSSDNTITGNTITATGWGIRFYGDSWMTPATGALARNVITGNNVSSESRPAIGFLRLTGWDDSIVRYNNLLTDSTRPSRRPRLRTTRRRTSGSTGGAAPRAWTATTQIARTSGASASVPGSSWTRG